MATILSWSSSNGEKGRCDAKCHNASSPPSECMCMCGGAYHGAARRGELHDIHQQERLEIIARAKIRAAAVGCTLDVYDHQPILPGL